MGPAWLPPGQNPIHKARVPCTPWEAITAPMTRSWCKLNAEMLRTRAMRVRRLEGRIPASSMDKRLCNQSLNVRHRA